MICQPLHSESAEVGLLGWVELEGIHRSQRKLLGYIWAAGVAGFAEAEWMSSMSTVGLLPSVGSHQKWC